MNKKIAVITMARNDNLFLSKWVSYYGKQFGFENLYIYLDGLDQNFKDERVNITKFEHKELSRSQGDKYRINLLNNLAKSLFKKGYDIVIGCDCDEFLIVDPNTNTTLLTYLSNLNINGCVSGLGLDVGQNLKTEADLDFSKNLLEQRSYALLSTRYTKPVVLNKQLNWGSGFHSVKGKRVSIDNNLYLLHFGGSDLKILKNKNREIDWKNHLNRRAKTIYLTTNSKTYCEKIIKLARLLQSFLFPIYSWQKPAMLFLKFVIKIPERFKDIGI